MVDQEVGSFLFSDFIKTHEMPNDFLVDAEIWFQFTWRVDGMERRLSFDPRLGLI